MAIPEAMKQLEQDIVQWRRDLHKIPEVGFDLHQTRKYVTDLLDRLQVEHCIAAETGIIATIYGENTGPTIALRADMDALPIQEETGLPYQSQSHGFMHACGHDAHVAMLLGVVQYFHDKRHMLHGNLRFIFQPAEETTGGARIMMEEGCLKDPDVEQCVGLHIGRLFEGVGNGQIGVRAGGMMASVDSFYVKIIGKGGHVSTAHESIDAIQIACDVVSGLQKISNREIKAARPVCVCTNMIHGGSEVNVMPESVELGGTIRTLDYQDRAFVEKRFYEVVEGIVQAGRARCEIDYRKYYPPLVNTDWVTQKLRRSASKIVGTDNVIAIEEPVLGAEDMAYYLKKVPGTYFILGSFGAQADGCYPHHHPKFDIDESTMVIGTAVFVQYVLDTIGKVQ